ncbi:MAG: hypothetical protein U0166_17860 [Acidobacteriota bacterium]
MSGAPPFVGDPVKVMFQHMNEKPAPPSWHAPGLSVDLEALILRLLQKEPRDRLGHADDVAAELLRLGAFRIPGSRNGLPARAPTSTARRSRGAATSYGISRRASCASSAAAAG